MQVMQEVWVRSLGQKDPLQYSCLENSMDRGACRLQSMGCKQSDMTEHTHVHSNSMFNLWEELPDYFAKQLHHFKFPSCNSMANSCQCMTKPTTIL